MSTSPKKTAWLTIEEFLAFTAERPEGERWELIEGVAYMSPSPTDVHQLIVSNIGHLLRNEKVRTRASWFALMGVGTRVPASPNSLPQPDVFVKETPVVGSPVTEDALVLFEIISKSNTRSKLAWRQKVYASIPNCQHYVTVSQAKPTLTRYDRASDWRGLTVSGLAADLMLPALGPDVRLPLAEIFRWTPVGPKE